MTDLSRVLLNSRSALVRRDLGDVHSMHRRVLMAFPDLSDDASGEGARARYQILYRVERTPGGELSLLVQAAERSDWSKLPEGYLAVPAESAVERRDLDSMLVAIQQGQRRRFRLRANVTRSVPEGAGERGRRVEVNRQDEACAWLERQSERAGFRIREGDDFDSFDGEPVKRIRAITESKVHGYREGRRVTLGSILFEGELEVVDAEGFRSVFVRGIGRGKAYGFGLLSLARC